MKNSKLPNILLAIADDQSWPYTSAYGCKIVKTPAFDRIAKEGILFDNAYCPAPQCSPSRAALLTGMNIWQLEEAGTHASSFPSKFRVYPEELENIGYRAGYTGKPWAPGSWEQGGRTRNPTGIEYNERKCEPPTKGIAKWDYAENFSHFLEELPEDQPFCFWFGCKEPHRSYEKGTGLRSGKKLEDVEVPGFLPDTEEIRSDLLDYALEIEWYDLHLNRMIKQLESKGMLDNTIIVVTSDNGMPFPRAKANMYEHSTHVPLAIRWGGIKNPGRVAIHPVSHIDFAPTFLEAAGLAPIPEMTGRSLMSIFRDEPAPDRPGFVVTGRERHSHARADNVGYPVRAIRTPDYLYIHNFKPDRWPAGDPDYYYDVDGSPTKDWMLEHRNEEDVAPLFELSFAKRPAEELYRMTEDPFCLVNLAEDAAASNIKEALRDQLEAVLTAQKDPRVLGHGDVFDSYPRYSPMKETLPGYREMGQYNPAFKKD